MDFLPLSSISQTFSVQNVEIPVTYIAIAAAGLLAVVVLLVAVGLVAACCCCCRR